ncbi:hypothetical protein [Streptomyces sp. N35]|uniref:hypothetical protein n=1 Tax=Streptomyces sp. N35 TaxID=2795730 RepID=UPI0018F5F1FA|nr:hypothetical protein [Streptomyces sp. N35]
MHHLRHADRDHLIPDYLEQPMDPLFDRTVPRRDVRTPWGWTRWYAVPGRDDLIQLHQIGVVPPNPPRATRLARRWLTRRPANLVDIAFDPHRTFFISFTTACVAIASFFLFGKLMLTGRLPVSVGIPLLLVAPLLTEFLPTPLDQWARRHAVVIETPSEVAGFASLLELQADLDAAAEESGLPECRAAASLGRELLWQAAVALHEFHHPAEAAELKEQLHNLACASVKACAAVLDLDERASTTPAVDGGHEKTREPAHDLHDIVDEVTRDLHIATDAHRHAADVLDGLDAEQSTEHPAADRTRKSDARSEKGGRA